MIDIFISEFMQSLAFSEADCQYNTQRAKVRSVILIYLVSFFAPIKDRFIPEL